MRTPVAPQIKRSAFQLSPAIILKVQTKKLPIGSNSQSIVKEFVAKLGDFTKSPNKRAKNYLCPFMKNARLAIFASGTGSNAAKIIEYLKDDTGIEISLVCTNRKDAPVIDLSKQNNIPVAIFSRDDFYSSDRVLNILNDTGITHIVLAGFLWLIPLKLIEKYMGRIINIHPALLPRHGGKGMYGIHVHEAVSAAGESETGITIHEVNEHYDEGKYLVQKKISLDGTETVEEIANKVQQLEHLIYPLTIKNWINNDL